MAAALFTRGRENVLALSVQNHINLPGALYYEIKGHRSLVSAQAQLKPWRATLGSRRAVDITTSRLLRLVREWKEAGATPATVNRRLSLLRRAYRLAKLRTDPARLDFAELFLDENSPRGRYLTAEAFAAIHANLPEHLRDFFEFAYLCGTRKQQLARTTWAHLNPHDWVLTWQPEEVKAKLPHEIALDGRPLEIIKTRYARRVLHCRYIFHGPYCAPAREPSKHYACVGDFKRAWATACKKAGFPVGRKHGGYVFHNTRHTAVTNLVNSGTPKHEAMGVSGHQTGSIFERYSIKLREQSRAALRRTTEYTRQLDTRPTVEPLANHRTGVRP